LKEFTVLLKKILIVDDSAAVHQIYQVTLARYKCPVITALSGQEGLNLLANNPDVSLLIVDMHMPQMSGIEFINRVKEQKAFKNIPIISVILKAKDNTVEAHRLADGILRKPFTSTEIHLEVEKLFPDAASTYKT
jgi:CheY-like chemotaxis protein